MVTTWGSLTLTRRSELLYEIMWYVCSHGYIVTLLDCREDESQLAKLMDQKAYLEELNRKLE